MTDESTPLGGKLPAVTGDSVHGRGKTAVTGEGGGYRFRERVHGGHDGW